MSKRILSRDQILAVEDLPREKLTIREWGGVVFVRGLTAGDRDRLDAAIVDGQAAGSMRGLVCVLSVVDEAGARLFKETDVELLAEKSASALDAIFAVASRLSGLSQDGVEAARKN